MVIPASETNVPVRVPIINDNLVEPSQEVFSIVLQLSGSDGGLTTVGTGVGTVDIMDDDSEYIQYMYIYVFRCLCSCI